MFNFLKKLFLKGDDPLSDSKSIIEVNDDKSISLVIFPEMWNEEKKLNFVKKLEKQNKKLVSIPTLSETENYFLNALKWNGEGFDVDSKKTSEIVRNELSRKYSKDEKKLSDLKEIDLESFKNLEELYQFKNKF